MHPLVLLGCWVIVDAVVRTSSNVLVVNAGLRLYYRLVVRDRD
jgi:hypothetical protein